MVVPIVMPPEATISRLPGSVTRSPVSVTPDETVSVAPPLTVRPAMPQYPPKQVRRTLNESVPRPTDGSRILCCSYQQPSRMQPEFAVESLLLGGRLRWRWHKGFRRFVPRIRATPCDFASQSQLARRVLVNAWRFRKRKVPNLH